MGIHADDTRKEFKELLKHSRQLLEQMKTLREERQALSVESFLFSASGETIKTESAPIFSVPDL